MRWAVWSAMIGLCACGGSQMPAASAHADGGGSITDPGDAGAPDAGPADAGPSADCIGIVPAVRGGALSFDVPNSINLTCAGACTDGQGVIAVEGHDAGTPPNTDVGFSWTVFSNSGGYEGAFKATAALFAQPTGFEGYTVSSIVLWDQYGGSQNGFTPVENGALAGPAFGGGTVAVGATSSGIVVHRVDVHGNESARGSAPIVATPLAAAEDRSGQILAVLQSGGVAKGVWFDLAHGTSSAAFDLGPVSHEALARGLTDGGVAVRLDGKWAATAQSGNTRPGAPPAWLPDGTDFSLVRGGKAYAVWPGSGNSINLVSTAGNACGAVSFSGVSSVSVGTDGSVVGASGPGGCSKLVWRAALQ